MAGLARASGVGQALAGAAARRPGGRALELAPVTGVRRRAAAAPVRLARAVAVASLLALRRAAVARRRRDRCGGCWCARGRRSGRPRGRTRSMRRGDRRVTRAAVRSREAREARGAPRCGVEVRLAGARVGVRRSARSVAVAHRVVAARRPRDADEALVLARVGEVAFEVHQQAAVRLRGGVRRRRLPRRELHAVETVGDAAEVPAVVDGQRVEPFFELETRDGDAHAHGRVGAAEQVLAREGVGVVAVVVDDEVPEAAARHDDLPRPAVRAPRRGHRAVRGVRGGAGRARGVDGGADEVKRALVAVLARPVADGGARVAHALAGGLVARAVAAAAVGAAVRAEATGFADAAVGGRGGVGVGPARALLRPRRAHPVAAAKLVPVALAAVDVAEPGHAAALAVQARAVPAARHRA
mmetsp:Transcript_35654/g.109907  ORF Transcript_35654/g.109907 Transcript_35654/m.109907 type:complete len:414 (+) Transcript_35654:1311-2552(+)